MFHKYSSHSNILLTNIDLCTKIYSWKDFVVFLFQVLPFRSGCESCGLWRKDRSACGGCRGSRRGHPLPAGERWCKPCPQRQVMHTYWHTCDCWSQSFGRRAQHLSYKTLKMNFKFDGSVISPLHQVGELSPAGGQEIQQGGRGSAAAGSFDLLTHLETFLFCFKCVCSINKQLHFIKPELLLDRVEQILWRRHLSPVIHYSVYQFIYIQFIFCWWEDGVMVSNISF